MDINSFEDLEKYKVQNLCCTAYYVREWVSEERSLALVGAVYGAPRPRWTQLSGRRLQNWGGVPHARGMLAERLPAWLQAELGRLPRGPAQLQVELGRLPRGPAQLQAELGRLPRGPAQLQAELGRLPRGPAQLQAELGRLPRGPAQPAPNHVLVNEYRPGQGIMPHEDGPLFHPVINTLSLGSHTVLRLWTRADDQSLEPAGALLLEPRSLLVLKDELYTNHLHSIEEVECDILNDTICNLDLCSSDYIRGATINRDTRISLTMRHVPKTTSFKLNIGNRIF